MLDGNNLDPMLNISNPTAPASNCKKKKQEQTPYKRRSSPEERASVAGWRARAAVGVRGGEGHSARAGAWAGSSGGELGADNFGLEAAASEFAGGGRALCRGSPAGSCGWHRQRSARLREEGLGAALLARVRPGKKAHGKRSGREGGRGRPFYP
jgi:hypothetical protein